MSKEQKTIGEFEGWSEASQQPDFFGESALGSEEVIINEKVENKSEEEIAAEKKEQELIDKQFSDFEKETSDEEEEETPAGTSVEKGKTSKVKIDNKATLEFLKEKGFVNYELEEGQELTDELAENLLEDSWEQSVNEALEESIQELPQEVKDLIRFANKGGNVNELLAKMAGQASSSINKNSDIDSESVQIAAVTEDLKAQGYDQEYIDDQIEFLTEKGKLESVAKKAFDKIVAKQEEETKNEVAALAQLQETRKRQAREYKSTITTHISSLDEVKGIPLTKQDKSVLPTYISEPSVELQDGRLVSEFQADLFKVMADKDKITLLAKLLKSDFDFSPIERKTTTATAKNIKNAVQNADKIKTASSEGVHKPSRKAVWDMID